MNKQIQMEKGFGKICIISRQSRLKEECPADKNLTNQNKSEQIDIDGKGFVGFGKICGISRQSRLKEECPADRRVDEPDRRVNLTNPNKLNKYIKPEIDVTPIAFENAILSGSTSVGIGEGPATGPALSKGNNLFDNEDDAEEIFGARRRRRRSSLWEN